MNAIMLLQNKNTVSYVYDTNTLRQGLEKMRVHGYTAIPVITKDGKYVGSVSEGDFLWHIIDNHDGTNIKLQEKYVVRDILRDGWNPAVRVDVPMDVLFEKAINQNFVPVTDDRGYFIGIVTRKDIMKYFLGLNIKQPSLGV